MFVYVVVCVVVGWLLCGGCEQFVLELHGDYLMVM